MITPRTTRLVRVPDLRALHHAVADRISRGSHGSRGCAVIVPTRGAAEELHRTLDGVLLARGHHVAAPDLLTRDEFYGRLHAAVPDAPPILTAFEREVLFRRAARTADAAGAHSPFRLRAGLIVEILDFYDRLRRRERTVADFARLMTGSLEPSAEVDRGAERMLRQTRFLTAAFEEFERRITASGRLDEHALRERLLAGPASSPFGRIVLTVADQDADERGLWSVDYALLTRLSDLEAVDAVVTEAVLAAGFHERIHDLLPGIEEERTGSAGPAPALAMPAPAGGREPVRWFVSRDREEELAAVARRVKVRSSPERFAVVFQRPLPYLYLAREVFADSATPYQALDALPLAAEPFAAAIDLVFAFISGEATRAATVELLRSPHWRFGTERAVERDDVAALDALLRELKYVGGWEQLAELATRALNDHRPRGRASLWHRAVPALQAAASAASELRQVVDAPSASRQIAALRTFIHAHERLSEPSDPWHERQIRARAAILEAMNTLALAHAAHDDEPLGTPDLFGTIRRWMEGQTFSPRTGRNGVQLLDARAAAFVDADEVWLLGLVDTDWAPRAERSIFYPASLLSQLGWPSDAARVTAGRAQFHDLMRLPRTRVSLSTFTLEGDAIVAPSAFLDELELTGFPIEHVEGGSSERVFAHEALSIDPIDETRLGADAAAWLALRRSRSDADSLAPATRAAQPAVYAVSHVERYLECPFKYFAAYVLRLDEERDDEAGLTPQERGQFVHAVFERFFAEWQASGRRSITTANLPEALALFSDVAESQLATLPEAERALERNHLLGSAVAPGLAERAFAFEIEQGGEVLERLLEHALEGEFRFEGRDGSRVVRLRAKADRIDLLADGTIRVIDYKLGRAPKQKRALQLPVYGVCAEQHLEGRHDRTWTLGRAGYVAFREKNPFVELGGSPSQLQRATAEGQIRLLDAIAAIESGTFPVRPEEPFLCTRCGFSLVCRKDYVGDE